MNNLDLHTPKRQAPVGAAVMFLLNLRRSAQGFLPLLILVFFSESGGFVEQSLAYIFLFIMVFQSVSSYLQYRNFYFFVEQNHFVITQGVLRTEKTNIPFERIQTVHITQNVVQRLLNVVGLKIETAGSAGEELEIKALERSYAEAIRAFLLERKQEVTTREQKAGNEDEFNNGQNPPRAAVNEEETYGAPLIRLNFIELLKVGLTENHLKSGIILFFLVNGYLWQYEEFLLQPFEPYLEEIGETFLNRMVIMLPFVVVAFLIIAVLYSLIRVTLQHFNLKFYLGNRGLKLESGLLKRNEYHIPRNKIQYFKWKSNPFRNLIGLKTLIVKQAVSKGVSDQKTVSVPGCTNKQLIKILRTFYPERYIGKFVQYSANYYLFIRLFLRQAIIPAAIAVGYLLYEGFHWYFFVPVALFLPAAAWWLRLYQRSVRMRISKEVVEIKKGHFFTSRFTIKFHKLQNIDYNQSYWQKRRGLATLVFHTAAGSEDMPHIPAEEAMKIYNLVLYKIETDERGWM